MTKLSPDNLATAVQLGRAALDGLQGLTSMLVQVTMLPGMNDDLADALDQYLEVLYDASYKLHEIMLAAMHADDAVGDADGTDPTPD